MFFNASFPKSLRAANVAEIALSARNLYITPDKRDFGILSLKLKQDESLLDVLETIFKLTNELTKAPNQIILCFQGYRSKER